MDTSEVNEKWDSFNIGFNYGRGSDGPSKVAIYSNDLKVGSVDLDSTGDWNTDTTFTDTRLAVPIESDCITLKFEFMTG